MARGRARTSRPVLYTFVRVKRMPGTIVDLVTDLDSTERRS